MARRVTRKLFEHEGSSYTLGRLSFKQMEEVSSRPFAQNEVALLCLQNGEPDENWTIEKIREEFDQEAFDFLFKDVTDFNGLQWKKKESGEAPATESITSNSAAESSQD